MKKRYLVLGLCLSVGVSTMLVACNKPQPNEFSTTDVYGMGAISTVRLLGSDTSISALNSLSLASRAMAQPGTSNMEIKQQIGKFNEYFTALDNFLNKDVVTTKTEQNQDEEFDYQTKLTINCKDFSGDAISYVMYYTETLVDTQNDEDEEEKMYKLEGAMVMADETYHLEGQRSDETEQNESESELKIRAYKDLADKTTYVEMEQAHSQEEDETESEYVYSLYSNGKLVERTEVEFGVENEDNQIETEYEMEFINGSGKGRYSIERVSGSGEITVEYTLNNKKGKFTVSEVVTGNEKQYKYTFSDGTSTVL